MDPPEVPKMLTKLSSTCVLEYLSFEKRQYICSQIPEIRNSEKSLSLHLNYLAISDVKIRLDQNEYYLDRKGAYSIWTPVYEWDCEKRKEVLPGDVCIGTPEPQELPGNAEIDPPGLPIELKMKRIPPPSEKENLLRRYLKNRRENAGMTDNLFKNLQTDNDNKTLVLFPPTYDSTPIHVAFKKLVFDLIGNRPIVYTKKLEFPKIKKKEFWIYRFPEDLKIQAEVLETDGFSFSYDDLDQISRILGPKPLKEFTTPLDNYEIFQHPIIRNSRKLVLSAGEVDFDHQRIQHRNIHLTDSKQLMNHINAWIRNPKDIGMEFSGDVESRRSIRIAMTYDVDLENISKEARIKEIMYGKKCRSGGRRVKADKRFPYTVYSISMPRTNNPDIEIQMSFIKNESDDSPFHIHLKVQPSGTATPEQSDSVYWELKLWEIRKILKTGECQSRFGQMFVCFMYLLFCFFLISLFLLLPSEKSEL